MRFTVCIVVGFVAVCLHAQQPPAPSLTETLIDQGAASLAAAAREDGDAVRGAILFSQQKLACVKCHQPGASDLLGPDLSRLGPEATDQYIVESLLDPSKVIKKGYEAVKILTEDGVVITGRVIRDTNQQITVRDNSDASVKRTLAKAAIERIEPSDVSAMPADLPNQLSNRQEFLDLCKYLIDLAASRTEQIAVSTAEGRQLSDRMQGLALIDQYRCVQCHRGDTGSVIPAAVAPDLADVTSRINTDYLVRYLRDPSETKPGTSMPNVLGHLDSTTRDDVVQAIASYLQSRTDRSFERRPYDSESAARGEKTFHEVGCVACHSPRDASGNELLADSSVPLGSVGGKYSIDSLIEFLEQPHRVRPSGRMPDMKLTHWEAVDLANYLVGISEAKDAPTIESSAEQVRRGREHFESFGCARCHESQTTHADSSPHIPLAKLRSDRGCLSTDPKRKIHYALTDQQRAKITAAIEGLSEPMDSSEQIELAMLTLRCYQCHQRDAVGGVSADRDLYFHTENPNLGPQGRIPPTLTKVGAKLKPKWMRQVLVSGRAIRPYVKTRMPIYGVANVEPLIELYQTTDHLPTGEWAEVEDPKEAKKIGTDLVGSGGLNCVACHTFQQKPAETMPAVDLTEMAERLKRDWFEHYMRDPQSLSPATVMPSFWPGGKSIRPEILDGDTDLQIATVWLYLQDGRQARQPRGLVIEPMELLATDEAVMLRRNYPGIGKRGIGVGYPSQVNLAFDAEQLRLAMLWQGKFADPGAAWRGQGSGTVRPLSREVIRFAAGPDLDDASSRWIVDEGRPPRHQFKGYRLDSLRRPAFRYRFDQIAVEDYFVDVSDEASGSFALQRSIRFETDAPRDGLEFRVASGNSIERVSDHLFRISDQWMIRTDERFDTELNESGDEPWLVIPLELSSGVTDMTVHYLWQTK